MHHEANASPLQPPWRICTVLSVPAATPYVRSHRNRKDGLRVILFPLFLVVAIFLARLVFASIAPKSGAVTAFTYVTAAAGLLFVILLPLGVALFFRKELPLESAHDKRSGRGKSSQIPPEILRWNWGAAGLGMIWGIEHHAWWSLLNIPPLSIIWWLILGVHGNAWAWSKNRWMSVEEFQASQRKWEPYGLAFFVIKVIVVVGTVVRLATMK